MPIVDVRVPARKQHYQIKIGPGILKTLGDQILGVCGNETKRIAIISNKVVFDLFGAKIVTSLRAARFTVNHWLMKDGEQHKSFRTLERAVEFLNESKLERGDAVVALGGGVVGDLAGFAAATYLRGVSLIQVPTTLLAQIDSSIGGKSGINLAAGKNLVGAFHQPRLVVIDTNTLRTLPPRELTSGWCEMIKQGAVGSRKLFDQTVELLRRNGFKANESSDEFSETIAAHCRFKASIVAADERESVARNDYRSRRILNFGHTTAHALEVITDYRRFRHGEAVCYGMLVAAGISKSLGTVTPGELESLRAPGGVFGALAPADDLSTTKIIRAMRRDKKSVNGNLKWILLDQIGRARIVDGAQIAPAMLRAALRAGLRRTQ